MVKVEMQFWQATTPSRLNSTFKPLLIHFTAEYRSSDQAKHFIKASFNSVRG